MIPRSLLLLLVYALVVLIVAFGVVMGGYALATAVGDALGAAALWWVAMGSLMLLAVVVLLLVGATGLDAALRRERRDDQSP